MLSNKPYPLPHP